MALVSGVILASGASKHAPRAPDCFCGSVRSCGRQTSPLSPRYRPRLATPAPSKAEARHRAEQTRGPGAKLTFVSGWESLSLTTGIMESSPFASVLVFLRYQKAGGSSWGLWWSVVPLAALSSLPVVWTWLREPLHSPLVHLCHRKRTSLAHVNISSGLFLEVHKGESPFRDYRADRK